jgi:hypothetical protein
MATPLLTTARKAVIVDEGESCNVTVTFQDMAGDAIVKASLLSLTATLYDEATESIINSRNAQSVLDANGGTVASDGTLTLRLQPLDAVIVGTLDAGEIEAHVLLIGWTWSDGVLTRTGKETREIGVRKGL